MQMKRTAILIDGEWFRLGLSKCLNGFKQPKPALPHGVTADVMYRNALSAIEPASEDLYRVFYYDCPPYNGMETNPIDGATVDFKSQKKFHARNVFLDEMGKMPFVALRLGVAKARGWRLNDQYVKSTLSGTHGPPKASDVFFNLEQKGVDMRLGIDVATLALKENVERIVMISGDTDMIPAMKLARREGVQVILVQLKGWHRLTKQLVEDADLVRPLTPTP